MRARLQLHHCCHQFSSPADHCFFATIHTFTPSSCIHLLHKPQPLVTRCRTTHRGMDNPQAFLVTSPRFDRQTDPNNADSWVMLNQGGFVKLGNERILQKLESRISCDLSVPAELRSRCPAFHRKSDKGTLFLTNKRVSASCRRINSIVAK